MYTYNKEKNALIDGNGNEVYYTWKDGEPITPDMVFSFLSASKEQEGPQFLFDLLAENSGTIVSTASLSEYDIRQARTSGRMWVNDDSLGFVWMPISKIPTTPDEVTEFEKWFPLEPELPESLKNPAWLNQQPPSTLVEGVEEAAREYADYNSKHVPDDKTEWVQIDAFLAGASFVQSKLTALQQENERLKGDAIGFAEWIDANGFRRERGRKNKQRYYGNWYVPAAGYGGGEPQVYTTSELYTLYLNNKNK